MSDGLRSLLESCGYTDLRQLPDGRWIGLMRFIFTTGLMVGLDDVGYSGRYCYEHAEDARAALEAWDGVGDPPGPWIKHKGGDGERSNPAAFKGVPIKEELR